MTFPPRLSLQRVAVRTAAAVAAAAAFALPLLAVLHARVPATTHAPMFVPGQTERLMPVAINEDESSDRTDGAFVHRIHLAVRDVPALTRHQRILIMVATYRTIPRLLRGELTFGGIACAYHAAIDREIADNYFVVFEQGADCAQTSGQPTGFATLEFRLRNRAHVALMTYIGAATPPKEALTLASPGMSDTLSSPIVVGETIDVYAGNGATRRDLLAYIWNVGAPARWIDIAIAIGGALIGCAVLLAWPGQLDGRFGAVRLTIAAFLAAFALSASYAVLYPPFQVADETSHFQVLSGHVGRPDLTAEAEQWARRGRFEEIRFHPYRTFSPLDRGTLGQPSTLVSVPTRDLYGTVRGIWHLLTPLVRNMDVQQVFLTVRIFHAGVFAGAAALFVLAVRGFTGATAAVSAVFPLLLVPTLPQFGMHVSNYALLLGAYTLVGAGMVIASWDSPRSWAAGPILGFGLGTAIGISRSSLPLLPLVAAVLAARVVLGDRESRARTAWAFWGGFTLLLAGMLMFIQTPYTRELDLYGALVSAPATAFTVLLRSPLLLIPFGAAGLMAEHLLTRVRGRFTRAPNETLVRRIALGAAGALFVLFAASLLVPYPVLSLYIGAIRPSAADYVRETVLACATFLRFGRPDWLTSVTFFAGFGWLDMVPPVRLVSLLAGTSGVMLVLLLVWIARARSTRALVWLGLCAAGFVASAAAYGLSIIKAAPSDLHGRYLMGLYVCALVVCWSGLGRTAGSTASRRSTPLAAVAIACAIAVNVYSLRLILLRYFS